MQAKDIEVFFTASSRAENDQANKLREDILLIAYNPSPEFLQDPLYGVKWKTLQTEWTKTIHLIGDTKFTDIKIVKKAGRAFNYDFDAVYYENNTIIKTRKIEFKYGAKTINKLPQFLSLQTRFPLFTLPYEAFYYRNYLDKYIDTDPTLIIMKPQEDYYLKTVTTINYDCHPFYRLLKEQEHQYTAKKKQIVNTSITKYLELYGPSINIPLLTEKFSESQQDKFYALWEDGKFHIDYFRPSEFQNIKFSKIKNTNVLELSSTTTTYKLLLRWRNHKGVLNPAWQISVSR